MFMSINDMVINLGFTDAIIFTEPSYENAIIGVTLNGSIIYDYEKMIYHLMKTSNMSYDDAVEWIDYNIIGYYPRDIDGVPPTIVYCIENGE